ncbi:hypothetical protein EYF80_005066 [Liparis tanakae]|uniref:Uncharacterized protein n=1 Tax=Liparis tanakae TaxID=230148 RepID=A0A4Z2J3Y9_9TELE|nr:hypothetical protein EYF80_005066 [Liparis tanakae]
MTQSACGEVLQSAGRSLQGVGVGAFRQQGEFFLSLSTFSVSLYCFPSSAGLQQPELSPSRPLASQSRPSSSSKPPCWPWDVSAAKRPEQQQQQQQLQQSSAMVHCFKADQGWNPAAVLQGHFVLIVGLAVHQVPQGSTGATGGHGFLVTHSDSIAVDGIVGIGGVGSVKTGSGTNGQRTPGSVASGASEVRSSRRIRNVNRNQRHSREGLCFHVVREDTGRRRVTPLNLMQAYTHVQGACVRPLALAKAPHEALVVVDTFFIDGIDVVLWGPQRPKRLLTVLTAVGATRAWRKKRERERKDGDNRGRCNSSTPLRIDGCIPV